MRRLPLTRQVLSQIALALIALFVLVPMLGMLRLAFDGSLHGAPTEFRLWPEQPTFDVFVKVWNEPSQSLSFPGLLANSLIVSVGSALAAVGLGASLAYAFARYRFPGRRSGLFLLLLTSLLPPIALTTPLFILLSLLRIRTSLLGLTVVYAALAMPFCIWNMRAAFRAVPKELEEAAFLDGAGALQTFRKVSLPLALPSIGVAALIAFLMAYAEFAFGWLFVESGRNVTLAMAVWGVRQMGSAHPWSQLAALAVLTSLPVVIVFVVLQRALLERMLFGTLGD